MGHDHQCMCVCVCVCFYLSSRNGANEHNHKMLHGFLRFGKNKKPVNGSVHMLHYGPDESASFKGHVLSHCVDLCIMNRFPAETQHSLPRVSQYNNHVKVGGCFISKILISYP